MDYRKEIDGLRAVAVLPVVFFHAGFPIFNGGFIGVDIFFVISGYLITTIIILDLTNGTFSLSQFYERRARRIFPALFFMLIVSIPFSCLWMLPQDLKRYFQSLVAVSLFSSNIYFSLTDGYFEAANEFKPLYHTWSLAVEEQFYVIFPILILLVYKNYKQYISLFMTLLFIISLLYAQYGTIAHSKDFFYMMPARGFELILGALVGIFWYSNFRTKNHSKVFSEIASVAGILFIIYAICIFDKNTPTPSLYTLLPTIGTGLIIAFANGNNIIGRILSTKYFIGFGQISYSLYLWHQPIFAFIRLRFVDPSTLFLAAAVFASVIISHFSWKYIETPFRKPIKIGRYPIFLFTILGSLFLLCVGLIGNMTYFIYGKTTDKDYMDTHRYPEAENCINDFFSNSLIKPDKCSSNSKKPIILVIGDSHAGHLYKGLTSSNIDIAIIWNGGCYAGATYSERCSNKTNAIKNYIRKNQKDIKLILLSNYLNLYLNPYDLNSKSHQEYEIIRSSFNNYRKILDDTKEILNFLKNLNISVGIIYDVPELKRSPVHCKTNNSCQQVQSRKSIFDSQLDQRTIYSLLSSEFQFKIFDPVNIFCDDINCYSMLNNSLLYWDTNHLNENGSILIGNELLRWFTKNFNNELKDAHTLDLKNQH